jgi:hypothetical protein
VLLASQLAVRAEAFHGLRARRDRQMFGFPNGVRRDDNLSRVVTELAFDISHGFYVRA